MLITDWINTFNDRHGQREEVQAGAKNCNGRKRKRQRKLKMANKVKRKYGPVWEIGRGRKALSCEVNREGCGMWHQAWMDPAGWMLAVRRWRGPLGLELAILFQALDHLSTSAPNVLFMLPNPLLLPHPSPMSNSSPLHAASTLFYSLFHSSVSSSKTSIIHQRPFFSFHLSFTVPSPTTVLLGGSKWRTPHPKSLFAKVVQTSRQKSRGVELHPKPFMIEQSAKWLTTAQNYCHITCSCSCSSRRASPNQAGVDFLQDLTTKILFVPLEPNTSP